MIHIAERREYITACSSALNPATEESQGPGHRGSAELAMYFPAYDHPKFYYLAIEACVHKELAKYVATQSLLRLQTQHFKWHALKWTYWQMWGIRHYQLKTRQLQSNRESSPASSEWQYIDCQSGTEQWTWIQPMKSLIKCQHIQISFCHWTDWNQILQQSYLCHALLTHPT